jgi:cell division protein ZapE
MPSPLQIYQQKIDRDGYQQDAAQIAAITALEGLYQTISSGQLLENPSVYLWGRVGRGKTYLMDCFYESLNGQAKRIHYYRFMQFLHEQLHLVQGEKDPLVLVANALFKEHKILCLDEFFVSDIADAMLLGRLMTVLFSQGMVLVTTSNVEPQLLYKDGLQRDRFLPAIAMLEKNLSVIELGGPTDHRIAKAQGFPHYYQLTHPLIGQSNPVYQRFLNDSEKGLLQTNQSLNIESRSIKCLARSGDNFCFNFEDLFIGPRSANDYIALSKQVKRIYILNVPQMGGALNERKVARGTEDTVNINQKVANRPFVLAKGDDEARRFISFIDEMYDQRKSVIISAAAILSQLYIGGRVEFEFERTTSRIMEMQADSYYQ